jgi:hypothetical protein
LRSVSGSTSSLELPSSSPKGGASGGGMRAHSPSSGGPATASASVFSSSTTVLGDGPISVHGGAGGVLGGAGAVGIDVSGEVSESFDDVDGADAAEVSGASGISAGILSQPFGGATAASSSGSGSGSGLSGAAHHTRGARPGISASASSSSTASGHGGIAPHGASSPVIAALGIGGRVSPTRDVLAPLSPAAQIPPPSFLVTARGGHEGGVEGAGAAAGSSSNASPSSQSATSPTGRLAEMQARYNVFTSAVPDAGGSGAGAGAGAGSGGVGHGASPSSTSPSTSSSGGGFGKSISKTLGLGSDLGKLVLELERQEQAATTAPPSRGGAKSSAMPASPPPPPPPLLNQGNGRRSPPDGTGGRAGSVGNGGGLFSPAMIRAHGYGGGASSALSPQSDGGGGGGAADEGSQDSFTAGQLAGAADRSPVGARRGVSAAGYDGDSSGMLNDSSGAEDGYGASPSASAARGLGDTLRPNRRLGTLEEHAGTGEEHDEDDAETSGDGHNGYVPSVSGGRGSASALGRGSGAGPLSSLTRGVNGLREDDAEDTEDAEAESPSVMRRSLKNAAAELTNSGRLAAPSDEESGGTGTGTGGGGGGFGGGLSGGLGTTMRNTRRGVNVLQAYAADSPPSARPGVSLQASPPRGPASGASAKSGAGVPVTSSSSSSSGAAFASPGAESTGGLSEYGSEFEDAEESGDNVPAGAVRSATAPLSSLPLPPLPPSAHGPAPPRSAVSDMLGSPSAEVIDDEDLPMDGEGTVEAQRGVRGWDEEEDASGAEVNLSGARPGAGGGGGGGEAGKHPHSSGADDEFSDEAF